MSLTQIWAKKTVFVQALGTGLWFREVTYHISDQGALQAKRKISGIPQNRHFKNQKPVNKWYPIFPFGKALIVPHLPKKTADDCRQGS